MVLVFSIACDKSGPGDVVNYDRVGMLTSISADVIIPAYEVYQSEIIKLSAKATAFANSPSESHLNTLRVQFMAAYEAWQFCAHFNFGPADQYLLSAYSNSFPTKDLTIEANIASGDYNLETIANIDATGLPALDYLLYAIEGNLTPTPAEIVEEFMLDSNRKDYLLAVVSQLETKINLVVTGWSGYQTSFNTNDGVDKGSSLSLLINSWNQYFETQTRDAKVGIPLGIRSLGTPIPRNAEGYFSQISTPYMSGSVVSMQSLLTSDQGSLSIAGYLDALNAQHSGQPLSNVIEDQMTTTLEALALINNPYSEEVINNPTAADAAYVELQKLTVLLKADMPSALGVLITYVDNDGD